MRILSLYIYNIYYNFTLHLFILKGTQRPFLHCRLSPVSPTPFATTGIASVNHVTRCKNVNGRSCKDNYVIKKKKHIYHK